MALTNAEVTWNGDKMTLAVDTSLTAGISESGKIEKIAFAGCRGEYISSPTGETFFLMLNLLKPVGTTKSEVNLTKRS